MSAHLVSPCLSVCTSSFLCLNSPGEPCDNPTSTCNGRNEMCHGRGPYWPDDQASSAEIGRRQWDKARELYESAQVSEGFHVILGDLDELYTGYHEHHTYSLHRPPASLW
jgi:hypothetical protein